MGITAALVAVTGSSAVSHSSDELATLSAARRGLGGLWELAQHIDGHFLPYYGFIHIWLEFGQAEWWMRLPSVLATGAAAALVADLGRRLGSLPAGLVASAVYTLLPSVSYHGQNARPYAFAAAAAVLATWALYRAIEEPGRRAGWWGYAAAVAVLGCTQVFALLVLAAHLFAVALYGRGVLLRMMAGMAVGCVPGAVWAVVGFAERHAISWIQLPGPDVFLSLPKMVGGTALAGCVVAALAAAGPFLRRRHDIDRLWIALLTGWALLPPLLLFTLSHLVSPVYVDRYLFATVPAYALLAGLTLTAVPRVVTGLALAGVLAAGIPGQLDVRREDGHHENFPRAVRIITDGAEPGDAIVYGRSSLREGFLYYGGGGLPDDVLRTGTAPLPDSFGYPERDDIAAALADRERVWVIWRGGPEAASRVERVGELTGEGFTRVKGWRVGRVPGMTVALYTR
ncbi:mannosyltransferase [Streptosporangium becharense]|uniref:Mannosyltransferase n=1 Tax=Streptosporangium becharense TaxID=1816182 RepID=A0A7W9IC13_9ACTN|nr:glycosyltransferase family 39 protein [Streptosporangium becharense]MBB2915233.1 mannosyltransferase [Streptosporangium becharense]MBB5817938.1 mannosyltransferase [Streptosporangium becharense]